MTNPYYWRGTGIVKSQNNAFTWADGSPSILADDRSCRTWKDGKTQGQYMADATAAFRKQNGKCRGTIAGISSKADAILAKRHSGVYAKAVPAAKE